jgi:hypothetical protein
MRGAGTLHCDPCPAHRVGGGCQCLLCGLLYQLSALLTGRLALLRLCAWVCACQSLRLRTVRTLHLDTPRVGVLCVGPVSLAVQTVESTETWCSITLHHTSNSTQAHSLGHSHTTLIHSHARTRVPITSLSSARCSLCLSVSLSLSPSLPPSLGGTLVISRNALAPTGTPTACCQNNNRSTAPRPRHPHGASTACSTREGATSVRTF